VPSVWFLNLDADHELARPLGYAPTDSVRARVDAWRGLVRGDLFEPGDIELMHGTPLPPEARGWPGRAWCMTPRARRSLSTAGALRLGPVYEQCCDPHGAWLENRPAPALSPEELQRLHDAAVLAAEALDAAGYCGPFGLDSYAWMQGEERRWHPLSDLDARYTMGWRSSELAPLADRPPFAPR